MIRQLDIHFAENVNTPFGFIPALAGLCAMTVEKVAPSIEPHLVGDKLSGFTARYSQLVSFPNGWDPAIAMLLEIICKQYERENPTRIMWVFGMGSLPVFRGPDVPESVEDVLFVEVNEREDYYGTNIYNPRREELRALAQTNKRHRMLRTGTIEEDHY